MDGRLSGYHNALNATNIRQQIQSWLKDAEYEQYQKRQTQPDFTNIGLESIRKLILTHFKDWKRIYYYEPSFDATSLVGGIYIEREDGNIVHEYLLSDGYRNFLWLFLEIAWRFQKFSLSLQPIAPLFWVRRMPMFYYWMVIKCCHRISYLIPPYIFDPRFDPFYDLKNTIIHKDFKLSYHLYDENKCTVTIQAAGQPIKKT